MSSDIADNQLDASAVSSWHDTAQHALGTIPSPVCHQTSCNVWTRNTWLP